MQFPIEDYSQVPYNRGAGIVGGLETLVYINNRAGWNSTGGWKL